MEPGPALELAMALMGSYVMLQLTDAQNSLSVVRNILGNNDLLDAVIKDDPEGYDLIQEGLIQAEGALRASVAAGVNPRDYESAILILQNYLDYRKVADAEAPKPSP